MYSKKDIFFIFINFSKKENVNELFVRLFEDSIRVLNEHAKDERVIVPMFKTFDFIIEKN